jgi:DegV family protein with EDD domain
VAIIFAPLTLLLAAGLCALPQAVEAWREQEDKRKLVSDWLVPKEIHRTKANVTVVTDSVSSLPPEMVQRHGIHIMPLALILDDKTYRDGVDIDTRQFYKRLREKGIVAKTSAPSPGEYQKLFTRLANDYDAAVVLTPPKELTHTWDAAVFAKEEVANLLTVDVVDSRVAGPAQGFLAIAAARAAAAGAPVESLLQTIQFAQQDVGLVAVLNTLEYLVAGGRVQAAKEWMASALRVYPIVALIDGHINLIGMARTKSKAIKRMVSWLESRLAHDEVALACFHTDALQEANDLSEVLSGALNPGEVFITEMTPVVGVHAGPGMVGAAWWTLKNIQRFKT